MYLSCNDIVIGSLLYKGLLVTGLRHFVWVLGMQFE